MIGDGRIGHAEIAIADGVLYLADEHPELRTESSRRRARFGHLMLHVDDTDAALHRAREHGATIERDVYENYGTRNATLIDPFGHRWMFVRPGRRIRQHPPWRHRIRFDMDTRRRPRSRLLRTCPGLDIRSGRRIGSPIQSCRLAFRPLPACRACSAATPSTMCRPLARRSPRRAVSPAKSATPTTASCWMPPTPRARRSRFISRLPRDKRPELNGSGPGELSYVTYQVTDSAGFREFYGRVLGWTFEPGHVADGWQVTPVHPMSGVAGGNDHPVTVPMWRVADIGAAVARVRQAGGTCCRSRPASPRHQCGMLRRPGRALLSGRALGGQPSISEIGTPAAILARTFMTLPGNPPPTTPTSTPSRS